MFTQTVVKGFPPNYLELKAVFPCGPETIFSWGLLVYRPNGRPIPRAILVHESVHGERQLAMGVEAWWRRYIDDSAFRFEEELVAHRAEWLAFCKGPPYPGRHARDRMLNLITDRLAGPLYGGLISPLRAKSMLV